MKELKLQKSQKSGPAGRKRKKYMYFDRLLFLMPTVENKRYRSSIFITKIDIIDWRRNSSINIRVSLI